MKLQWPGFNEKGSVIIALPAETCGFPASSIIIDNIVYQAKDELHVTLIGSSLGLELQQRTRVEHAVTHALTEIFEAVDWSFRQTGPVHILSREKDSIKQGSIVMLIDMPGISVFYNRLKARGIIGVDTPVPPAHITLYTHNCPTGIGLSSDEVLAILSVKSITPDKFNAQLEKQPAS